MKRYIITTAQANVRPHKAFKEGLEAYAAAHDAQILVFPTFGKHSRETDLHTLLDYPTIDDTFHFNRSIKAQRRRIRPQMIDPVTGLSHVVRDGKSVIFESPQIRLKTIPTNGKKLPKFLMTTGAVTLPRYADVDDPAERQRLGMIAKDNHTYGAIILEVQSREKYTFRHLHANAKGEFVDFGTAYYKDQQRPSQCEAIVYADWHNERGDPLNYEASKQLARELKPRIGVFHDFFDGHSVNPHMRQELIYQQIREGVDRDHLNLELELRQCGESLEELAELHDEVYLVPSNHHEFLNRWLDEGQFVRDPKNARFGFHLAEQYSHGLDPLEAGIKLAGITVPSNVHIMPYNESLRIKGYECGHHGHKGPNGARGNINRREDMYGRTVSGHHHSPEERHHNHTVGTHLPRDIFYTKGSPSGWLCRNLAIFDTGTTQSYNTIDGKFR